MIRVLILIPVAALLLSCGLVTGINDSTIAPVTGEILAGAPGGEIADPLYAGDSLVEEKIIRNPVIVRATMTSLSSEVVTDAEGKHRIVLKFSLNVNEYLKGAGPSSIVAVWMDGTPYNSSARANDAKAAILAERDNQWDDREAVIFLFDGADGFGSSLDRQLRLADHFLLALGHRYFDDDRYSLHSTSNKEWLPAAGTSPTGDDKEFLLDVPPPMETITLGELKREIIEVAAELDGGNGSEEYQECVLEKYRYMRNQRNWPEERGRPYTVWNIDHTVVSGQPAGTVLAQRKAGGIYPDTKITIWLEGSSASLFDTAEGDSTNVDKDGDGEYDEFWYDEIVRSARPLPAGEYGFELKEDWPNWAVCNFVISNPWTVTVNAPDGVAHEALFDPVADGSTVAADSAIGVLEPASFVDAGATTTIERIEWEAGTAKMKLTPHTALAGRVVDFIELDGTVSLSLTIDDATVDTANNTLSWSVSPQPWDDGDKLMLRIR